MQSVRRADKQPARQNRASFAKELNPGCDRKAPGQTAGDYLCERLIERGVGTMYGLPVDGINGILGALSRVEGRLRFIQTRHQEMAPLTACGPRQVHW